MNEIQFTGDNVIDVFEWMDPYIEPLYGPRLPGGLYSEGEKTEYIDVFTCDGYVRCYLGMWIVRDECGKFSVRQFRRKK